METTATIEQADVDEISRRITKWRRALPFAAYDHNDLLSAALEHLTLCSQMGIDHWRAIFWGRLRWRLIDEIRANPRCGGARRTYEVVSIIDTDYPVPHDTTLEAVEIDDLIGRLEPRDARVARSLMDGATLVEIAKNEGVTEGAVCMWRKRIASVINTSLCQGT